MGCYEILIVVKMLLFVDISCVYFQMEIEYIFNFHTIYYKRVTLGVIQCYLNFLFIINTILSTFYEFKITANGGHDLSLIEVHLVTLDENTNPELELEDPIALDNFPFNKI